MLFTRTWNHQASWYWNSRRSRLDTRLERCNISTPTQDEHAKDEEVQLQEHGRYEVQLRNEPERIEYRPILCGKTFAPVLLIWFHILRRSIDSGRHVNIEAPFRRFATRQGCRVYVWNIGILRTAYSPFIPASLRTWFLTLQGAATKRFDREMNVASLGRLPMPNASRPATFLANESFGNRKERF